MKAAFILHCRNKAKYVDIAVRSMLVQETREPIEILLSDSGSTDGSWEILQAAAQSYNGPHKVRAIRCPHQDYPGMHGLNQHINWTMTQTDADIACQLSADDYALQGRVQHVVDAFEAHKPSMVLTGMFYVEETTMKYLGESAWPNEDGWCKLEEMYPKFVGGSASQSWSHEFFDKLGGLEGVGSQDVVMPFLAVLDKGAWYVHKRLHAYRKVVDPLNTGLEGVLNSVPENTPERLQIEELIHFQVIAGHYGVLRKMHQTGLGMTAEVQSLLAQAILDRAASWTVTREMLSLRRIPPREFRA